VERTVHTSAEHRVNKYLSLLMMPNAPEHLLPSPSGFRFYLYVAMIFSFTTDLLVNDTASDGSVNSYCKKAFKSNPIPQIRHQFYHPFLKTLLMLSSAILGIAVCLLTWNSQTYYSTLPSA